MAAALESVKQQLDSIKQQLATPGFKPNLKNKQVRENIDSFFAQPNGFYIVIKDSASVTKVGNEIPYDYTYPYDKTRTRYTLFLKLDEKTIAVALVTFDSDTISITPTARVYSILVKEQPEKLIEIDNYRKKFNPIGNVHYTGSGCFFHYSPFTTKMTDTIIQKIIAFKAEDLDPTILTKVPDYLSKPSITHSFNASAKGAADVEEDAVGGPGGPGKSLPAAAGAGAGQGDLVGGAGGPSDSQPAAAAASPNKP